VRRACSAISSIEMMMMIMDSAAAALALHWRIEKRYPNSLQAAVASYDHLQCLQKVNPSET